MKKITLFFISFIFILSNCVLAQKDVQNRDTILANVPLEWDFNKYRFGGYGEILYQQMNYSPDRYKDPAGASKANRSYISIPRTVFSFEYKFREDIVFSTELEIEYGGTGSAMELEYEEGGEYEMEMEKGGEIELEQFHITKRFSNAFNIRAGHLIVPIGLTNAHHEPIFFFGTTRPEGEITILPCTWHETGVSVLGYYSGFKYEIMLVNGLDPNGFSSSNWVKGGRQSIFETSVMTNPAIAGRIEYSGIKNLRLAASGYHGKTAKNASKPQKMTGIKAPVSILSTDAQYISNNLAIRANFIYGELGASKRVSQINRTISRNTGFPRTPVAKNAMTYSIEAGYNILLFFKTNEKLMPFFRYEYYNSAENVEKGMSEMLINKRNVYAFGLNYSLLSNVLLKADYSIRKFGGGNYNGENTFGLALAYTGWFFKK
jgi:opacity protein-like surface antigen